MTPEEHFGDLVQELLGTPGVTPPAEDSGGRRSFGSNGLKVDGRIFAMLVRGRLVVKLPRNRVDELVAAGEGERFETARVMKEWLTLSPSSGLDWLELAREALAFVRPA
ncbi:MAG TPA: hypothetical protein VK009_22620 [Chloroflexota bacterium]|nr:hypothetical protein [Chloroflexota bacterium]